MLRLFVMPVLLIVVLVLGVYAENGFSDPDYEETDEYNRKIDAPRWPCPKGQTRTSKGRCRVVFWRSSIDKKTDDMKSAPRRRCPTGQKRDHKGRCRAVFRRSLTGKSMNELINPPKRSCPRRTETGGKLKVQKKCIDTFGSSFNFQHVV